MRLLIQVFLSSEQNIRKDVPALGNWDYTGVSEELDYSLPQFPKDAFVNVKGTQGAAVSVDGNYSWRVAIPTAEDLQRLKITQLPAIRFYDVQQNNYVGGIDGTPQARGVVAELLRGVMTPKSTTTKQLQKAGMWALALLLLFKIKKTT